MSEDIQVVSDLPDFLRKPASEMSAEELHAARLRLLEDPELLRLIKKRQLRKINAAQKDPIAFFEFVMREETTRAPIKVTPHQKVILSFVMAHPFSVLMLPVGHSKCHGPGTPILMADGRVKPVESVIVGESVMGPSGPRRVTHTSSGKGALFRVVPVKGSDPFVVNEDHILTLVQTESGKVIDVSVREFLTWAKSKRADYKLFRSPVKKFISEKCIDIDPYFLGVWFGDGLHRTSVVKLTNIDFEVRAMCVRTAEKYGLKFVSNDEQSFSLSLPGGKACGGKKNKNPLMQRIRETVGSDLSMEKLKTAPWEQRAAFLAGFIDADGSMKDRCIYITQKRKDWIDAIEFIARSLGISVARGTVENPQHGTYHRVCLYGDMSMLPIRIPRKKPGVRAQKKDARRTGFVIEPLGEGRYYGFTISGDGRYLLGDFTVTHNTFSMAGLCLYLMGQDPTLRGAILSATQTQAMKPLSMVRDYIEASPELRAVFPHMMPSPRSQDPWTQTALTVARPAGIRDASLVAIGVGGAIAGARLNFILVDDILDMENTATKEQRDKVYEYVQSTVMSRLDPKGARLVVTNTAWHPEDLPHRLEALGKPTLRMSITGDIKVTGEVNPEWGVTDEIAKEIRPKTESPYELVCRLTANDPDPKNEKTLWPARVDNEEMAKLKKSYLPHRFKQLFEQECRDDGTSKCKVEYIEACKAAGRRLGLTGLFREWTGEGDRTAFTGVDLAVRPGEGHDDTAFFTFYVRPEDGIRVIIDIEFGQMSGPQIIDKLFEKQKRFNSMLHVENNAAQDYIRQFALQRNASLPVSGHTTGKSKADPTYGVEGLFVEMSNGAWAIPADKYGRVDPRVQKWIDACLYYNPEKHTPDILMACWFAMEKARSWGLMSSIGQKDGLTSTASGFQQSIAMSIMSR